MSSGVAMDLSVYMDPIDREMTWITRRCMQWMTTINDFLKKDTDDFENYLIFYSSYSPT